MDAFFESGLGLERFFNQPFNQDEGKGDNASPDYNPSQSSSSIDRALSVSPLAKIIRDTVNMADYDHPMHDDIGLGPSVVIHEVGCVLMAGMKSVSHVWRNTVANVE